MRAYSNGSMTLGHWCAGCVRNSKRQPPSRSPKRRKTSKMRKNWHRPLSPALSQSLQAKPCMNFKASHRSVAFLKFGMSITAGRAALGFCQAATISNPGLNSRPLMRLCVIPWATNLKAQTMRHQAIWPLPRKLAGTALWATRNGSLSVWAMTATLRGFHRLRRLMNLSPLPHGFGHLVANWARQPCESCKMPWTARCPT